MSPEAVFVADATANVAVHREPHEPRTGSMKDSLHKPPQTEEHVDGTGLKTTTFF